MVPQTVLQIGDRACPPLAAVEPHFAAEGSPPSRDTEQKSEPIFAASPTFSYGLVTVQEKFSKCHDVKVWFPDFRTTIDPSISGSCTRSSRAQRAIGRRIEAGVVLALGRFGLRGGSRIPRGDRRALCVSSARGSRRSACVPGTAFTIPWS